MTSPPFPPHQSGQRPPILSGLDRAIGGLAWFAAVLGAGIVVGMMAIVVYSVVNRYILGTPITWTDELSGYLVVALVMLGAAEALRRGDHISVDLITGRLPPGARRLVDVWGNILVLVVAASLLISGKATIAYSVDFDIFSEGYLEVPMWIPQSFILLGAGMLALVAIANLLRLMRKDGAS